MDIFISWSGDRSLAVAEALRDWLPMVINAAKPFLSVEDIDKGARWSSEVAGRLEKSKAGIICLTPGNMSSHWLLFEAGALSKTINNTYVCPLLIGLRPADVKGPLAQFQFTTTDKLDMLQLFKTLNSALAEEALPELQVERAFELVWPKLKDQLKKAPFEEEKVSPERPEREILEEMLELVRNLGRAPVVGLSPSPPVVVRDMLGERELHLVLGTNVDALLKSQGQSLEALSVKYFKDGHYFQVTATPQSGATLQMEFDADMRPDSMAKSVATRVLEQPRFQPPVNDSDYWIG